MHGLDRMVDPRARRTLGIGALALALALVAGLLCMIVIESVLAMETIETEFPTGRALRDAGMVEKGWVPGWIPDDAFDVREIHNIDSNQSGIAFRLRAGSRLRLPTECRRGAAHGFAGPRFDREWLVAAETRFDLYTCPEDRPYPDQPGRFRAVAAERAGSRVVSWTFWENEGS